VFAFRSSLRLESTEIGRGLHGFWKGSARILVEEERTDLGKRVGGARLYLAVDEASVPVAMFDTCGIATRATMRVASSFGEPVKR
jgi:hypothetical protein